MSNFSILVKQLIQQEMARGAYQHELVLELGPTPDLLVREAGFPKLDLVVKYKAISKMCFDHGIGTSTIQNIPNLIKNPKCLYRSTKIPNSAVVLTFEWHSGFPIVIAVHANKSVSRISVDLLRRCNEVKTMYAKEGPDPTVKWKDQGLLLWEAGKKNPL